MLGAGSRGIRGIRWVMNRDELNHGIRSGVNDDENSIALRSRCQPSTLTRAVT